MNPAADSTFALAPRSPTFWTATDGGELGLSHNPDSEATYLDSLVVTRAFENECCVVFVNCGGSKDEGFIGRSAVTLPFKGKVGGTTTNEEEMVLVEVDLDVLKVSRIEPLRRHQFVRKLRR